MKQQGASTVSSLKELLQTVLNVNHSKGLDPIVSGSVLEGISLVFLPSPLLCLLGRVPALKRLCLGSKGHLCEKFKKVCAVICV